MSVAVRHPDGRIQLHLKGADDVVFERLAPLPAVGGGASIVEVTREHLKEYAENGLRTLCLAVRDLDAGMFTAWHGRFRAAAMLMDAREKEKNIATLASEMEHSLVLVGAVAIEDQLQDGVPEAIATMHAAGLRVWVLTGDKQETAINIANS